jgi:hypothetical protein
LIFEPHTDLIKRGKVQTPIEFGHKVFLAESAHGLITQYEVLYGNSVDEQHGVPSLKRHNQAFGRAPDLFATKIAPQMTGRMTTSAVNLPRFYWVIDTHRLKCLRFATETSYS